MKILVSPAEQDRRISICRKCPERRLVQVSKKVEAEKCEKCGCWLKPKTWIPGQSCPLGKW